MVLTPTTVSIFFFGEGRGAEDGVGSLENKVSSYLRFWKRLRLATFRFFLPLFFGGFFFSFDWEQSKRIGCPGLMARCTKGPISHHTTRLGFDSKEL